MSEAPTLQSTADAIEKAADLIESVGHTKGEFVASGYDGDDGPEVVHGYCVMGALMTALEMQFEELDQAHKGKAPWKYQEANDAIMDVLGSQNVDNLVDYEFFIPSRPFMYDPYALSRWNDADFRTPEEVVDLLKETAKMIRNTAD